MLQKYFRNDWNGVEWSLQFVVRQEAKLRTLTGMLILGEHLLSTTNCKD